MCRKYIFVNNWEQVLKKGSRRHEYVKECSYGAPKRLPLITVHTLLICPTWANIVEVWIGITVWRQKCLRWFLVFLTKTKYFRLRREVKRRILYWKWDQMYMFPNVSSLYPSLGIFYWKHYSTILWWITALHTLVGVNQINSHVLCKFHATPLYNLGHQLSAVSLQILN